MISRPIQNRGKKNTINAANVIQPPVDIRRSIRGWYVLMQFGHLNAVAKCCAGEYASVAAWG